MCDTTLSQKYAKDMELCKKKNKRCIPKEGMPHASACQNKEKRLPDEGRSMYLLAEWGPRTQEPTLLGDSATTTRHAGLGHARKGFSEDQDERL